MKKVLSAVLILNLFAQFAAAQIYVSPTGSAAGTGTLANPYNLQTALNLPSGATAGKTIYLRGGTYTGKYTSSLQNTTVRSYPGEWAKIDGYFTTTTTSALSATTPGNSATLTLANLGTVVLGSTLKISNTEIVYVFDINGSTLTVQRGWAATPAPAHASGSSVVLMGNVFSAGGSNTIYRDFEIMDSSGDRNLSVPYSELTLRGTGVTVLGNDLKFINLLIHDTLDGLDKGQPQQRTLVYGCIIYNNGFVDTGRGQGFGLYIQNETGLTELKEVISFNNAAGGMKAFGETAQVQNILFEGIISFNNGSFSAFSGNPAGYAANHRWENIMAGTNCDDNDINLCTNSIRNITIRNNFVYQPQNAQTELGNVRVGFVTRQGSNVHVQDNYIAGGHLAFEWVGVNSGSFTGNTVYAKETIANVNNNAGASLTWNNNTYYDVRPPNEGWIYSFSWIPGTNRFGAGLLVYDDAGTAQGKGWKQWTGFDANSSYNLIAPSGTQVFVRPNAYEQGRAHIAVYNWALASSVNVNLSNAGLIPGQKFEIRNAQNYFDTPVLANQTYTAGMTVTLPTNLTVAAPTGGIPTPATVSPEFNVYVVKPLQSNIVHYYGGTPPLVN